MKTSNKILSISYSVFIFLMITGFVVAKNNMVITHRSVYEGSGELQIITLSEELISSKLLLGNDYNYILDPTRTDVTITGENNLVERITYKDKGAFSVGRDYEDPFSPTIPMEIVIGIQGKSELEVHVNSSATITSSDVIQSDLTLVMKSQSSAILTLDNQNVVLLSNHDAKPTLKGKVDKLRVMASSDAEVNLEDLEVKSLNLTLNDRAKLIANTCEVLDAILDEESSLSMKAPWGSGELTNVGRGEVFVAGEKWRTKK